MLTLVRRSCRHLPAFMGAAAIVAFATVYGCNDQNAGTETSVTATTTTASPRDLPPVVDAAGNVVDLDALWPPVRARPSTLNFGEIPFNQPTTKTVALVNMGDIDVRLSDTRSNCGCTTADVAGLVVPAHGSVDLPIHFDAEGRVGPRSATVSVFFDGWEREIKIKIEAVVVN